MTIIGPGNMGRALATRLLAGGHTITLSGRDRQQAEALAAELEPQAQGEGRVAAASGPEEAVPDSDLVILAMWYTTNLEVARQHASLLRSKVVVDICNPVNESFDGLATEGGPSAAERIRDAISPDARVVKAFNTTFAGTLIEGEVAGQTLDVLIAGDEEEAVARVVELVRSSELRPIRVGALARARQLEALGFLGMAIQEPLGTSFMTGWKLLLPGTAPRRGGGKGFPRNAVVGVLDDPGAAGGVVHALREAGIEEQHFHVLYGAEGRQRIEAAWEGQGLLYEFMQLGYEHDHTERHMRELAAGHAVVVVEADDDATAQRAGEILAEHGGHFVNHYGRWMARSVVP